MCILCNPFVILLLLSVGDPSKYISFYGLRTQSEIHGKPVSSKYFEWLAPFPHGSKGWRSGESTRLPPVWPGFEFRRRRHMWVEFVVGSLPCSERFYTDFPYSSKTNFFKFQFDQESSRRRTTYL